MKKSRLSKSVMREARSRHKRKLVALVFYISVFITAGVFGCSTKNTDPAYLKAQALPAYQQASFEQYIQDTQQWLADNRVFKSNNHQQEILLNSPFELIPNTPNGQAVLLVHGLGDSPYSFHDIAAHLVEQGYLVRAVLLPGHGSKAGDLLLPSFADWENLVSHHAQLLLNDYPNIWLGGYSTGANLVTSYALNDERVSGLLLFSPAFQPKSGAVKYARFASYFMDWADQDPENNVLRYNSLPMNGAAVYYQTSKVVQDELKMHAFNKPSLLVLSETDSVVDTQAAYQTFEHRFTNENSRLIWQGEHPPQGKRVLSQTMVLPDYRVSNGSHMGMLFSPNNPYYGQEGSITICDNGQREVDFENCELRDTVWYSAYGYQEPGKIHARLTFNPYFSQLMQSIDLVMKPKS
ncbi:Thermostable monoacylglycerol lipase [Vibrio thalassae]|uniref:Thermostable monoacylglycerol lipase n=1 Tax=Vibrio thalassae TaxID=1243014 RepID=A0A240EIT4_9VIBR|nr:alpha/beta fold hydrolase [Vibrio thalassae]SNX48496.1 Thermostable monoacylglycerol lipase [Vibrio thalassae]